MKRIIRKKSFEKSYQKNIKPYPKILQRTLQRIQLFLEDRNNPILADHQLYGSKKGLRAFSVTEDIRVIYFELDTDFVFLDIGTHNQVY